MADDERLDKALSDYLIGKHPKQANVEPLTSTLDRLEILREVPERDAEAHANGKQIFLQQARTLLVPVSREPKQRHKGRNKFFRKERLSMSKVISGLVVMILAFGGVGTVAYAAQDSLPTEPLYPMKQFTEQVRLALTSDPEAEMDLLLELTEERISEITTLADEGLTISTGTQLCLEQHLQKVFSQTAQLGEPAMLGALERIQNMAQNQIQTLQQLKQSAPDDSSEGLEYTIGTLYQVQQAAEEGLAEQKSIQLVPVQQEPNAVEDSSLDPTTNSLLPAQPGSYEPKAGSPRSENTPPDHEDKAQPVSSDEPTSAKR
jgi:hypothetical protein